MRDAVDLRVEARVALHVVDHGALSAARHPAGEAPRRREPEADDRVLAERLGGGEDELVALGVVQHQRERLGLREGLQPVEDDAQDLGELERRRERPGQLDDGAKLAKLLLDGAPARGRGPLSSRRCHGSAPPPRTAGRDVRHATPGAPTTVGTALGLRRSVETSMIRWYSNRLGCTARTAAGHPRQTREGGSEPPRPVPPGCRPTASGATASRSPGGVLRRAWPPASIPTHGSRLSTRHTSPTRTSPSRNSSRTAASPSHEAGAED